MSNLNAWGWRGGVEHAICLRVTYEDLLEYLLRYRGHIPIRSVVTYCLNWIGIYVYVRRYLCLDKWPIADAWQFFCWFHTIPYVGPTYRYLPYLCVTIGTKNRPTMVAGGFLKSLSLWLCHTPAKCTGAFRTPWATIPALGLDVSQVLASKIQYI